MSVISRPALPLSALSLAAAVSRLTARTKRVAAHARKSAAAAYRQYTSGCEEYGDTENITLPEQSSSAAIYTTAFTALFGMRKKSRMRQALLLSAPSPFPLSVFLLGCLYVFTRSVCLLFIK